MRTNTTNEEPDDELLKACHVMMRAIGFIPAQRLLRDLRRERGNAEGEAEFIAFARGYGGPAPLAPKRSAAEQRKENAMTTEAALDALRQAIASDPTIPGKLAVLMGRPNDARDAGAKGDDVDPLAGKSMKNLSREIRRRRGLPPEPEARRTRALASNEGDSLTGVGSVAEALGFRASAAGDVDPLAGRLGRNLEDAIRAARKGDRR